MNYGRLIAASLGLLVCFGYGAYGQTLFFFSASANYFEFADSPFDSPGFDDVVLEDFEDGAFNTAGVSVVEAGSGVSFPGENFTDSVDGDDLVFDLNGNDGHGFDNSGGVITFEFDDQVLGAFPTAAGLVWTDGLGTTSFEAFGPTGESIGVIGPVAIADNQFRGEAEEDRFFGVVDTNGISAIRISNTAGAVETDHLQFGTFIPEPSSVALLMFAGLALLKTRRH